MWTSVLAFALVAGLLTVTPGVDFALVLRNTLAAGRATGLRTSLGICSGLLVWGVLSAVGVSAVLAASRAAYDALRIAGAAYLLYLGGRTLLATRRGRAAGTPDAGGRGLASRAPRSTRAAFRTGLLNNLLNPKVGVFYVTLLPQFIPAHAPVLGVSMLLASIHAVEGIAWLALVTVVVSRVGAVMRREPVRRALERVTGAVLIGFGARVALERL
jgi:threonine/homoserine/homoserine lactone efflux protein